MYTDPSHLSAQRPLQPSADLPSELPAHIPAALRSCFAAQRAAFARQRFPSLQERRADLRAYNQRLLDYAKAGGTVVVQYNKFEFNQAQYGPFPAKVTSDRVTDEKAPVAPSPRPAPATASTITPPGSPAMKP